MGPRLISRGVGLRDAFTVVNLVASMGPRLISRGVRVLGALAQGHDHASMGPRLISRGVRAPSDAQHPGKELQWGRGSLAAA